MSAEIKQTLLQQLKTSQPQIEQVISEYLTDENVKQALSHFVEWLQVNGAFPLYVDCEGQSPFWEIKFNGKKLFIVCNGASDVSIMVLLKFTDEYQALIQNNNLQDMILANLQPCSRTNGEHCSNCNLPPDVAGVSKVLFGKETKNLCCGDFISFNNPNSEIIECIKKLLEY